MPSSGHNKPLADPPAALGHLLGDVLAGVLERPVTVAGLRPLAGLSNRTYHVRTGQDEDYVVKLRLGGAGDVLELAAEAALTRRVAAAGLAPEVLGIDGARGALVTAYRSGARPWNRAMARRPENVRRIAGALGTLHRLPGELRAFECVALARRYVAAAAGAGPFGPRERRLAAELMGLAEEFEAQHPASVLCHNDLIAENILDDGVLTLVDFEYAMRAAPVLDLASYAAMNRLARKERGLLLAAYYGDSMALPAADFDRVVRLVDLIALFWARAAAAGAENSDRFAEFADSRALGD